MTPDTTLAREIVDDGLSAVHNAAEAWHHDANFHAFAEGLVPILAAMEAAGQKEEIPPARVRRMLQQTCFSLLDEAVAASVTRQRSRSLLDSYVPMPELDQLLPPGSRVVYDTTKLRDQP